MITLKDFENAIAELKRKRQAALDNAEALYYTPTCPQYKDNERYAWAVKAINKGFDEDEQELMKLQPLQQSNHAHD